MIDKALYKPQEVADLLGVTVGTLARWRMEGTNLDYCKIGNAVRYRVSDVHEYIDRNVVKGE